MIQRKRMEMVKMEMGMEQTVFLMVEMAEMVVAMEEAVNNG